MASLFTSLYPSQHGVTRGSATKNNQLVSDVLPPSLPTMAEVFQNAGYATFGSVHNPQLKESSGFARGFDQYLWSPGGVEDVLAPFKDWVDSRGDTDQPFFAYLHVLDVHAYQPAPEYRERFGKPELEYFLPRPASLFTDFKADVKAGWKDCSEQELAGILMLYDATILETDDALRDTVRFLDERGEWEDTLFVFLSDHGEEFFEHRHFGHGHSMVDNLLRVPWVMRLPGDAYGGRRINSLASLVDVLPTIADLCGLTMDSFPHAEVSHRSQIDGPQSDGPERLARGELFRETTPTKSRLTQSLQDGRFHFIRTWTAPRPGFKQLLSEKDKSVFEAPLRTEYPHLYKTGDELFDMENDPGEFRDVLSRHPEVADKMREALARIDINLLKTSATSVPEFVLDDESIEELRSLGYVE